MKQRPGDADRRARADAEDHVADLGDRVIPQKPLKIVLNQRYAYGKYNSYGANKYMKSNNGG